MFSESHAFSSDHHVFVSFARVESGQAVPDFLFACTDSAVVSPDRYICL
jgi:hypothetical protein